MLEKIREKLIKYEVKDDIIIIGVSGGPDSMVLISVLLKLKEEFNYKIVCAHINHNVRKESTEEQKFVESYCKKNNVIFETMRIEKYSDDNFHNEAREIRYNFFETLIKKYSAKYLFTAHHGDDLIETVLMRLVRGSTLKGYAGFSEIVKKDGYLIIRPLIDCTKDEILNVSRYYKVPYIIDKSNFKVKYTRNRYRKYLLPFLKQEEENVHLKFLKFNKTLEMYNEYIDKEAKNVYDKIYKNNCIDIAKFLKIESLLQEKIIYYVLEEIYQDDLILISNIHVDLILNLINSNKGNIFIYLPNEVKVVKEYNTLLFKDTGTETSGYDIELQDYAKLPNGKSIEIINKSDETDNNICRINSKDIVLPLYVRTRKHGDKITLKGIGGTKKVKDILIDSKIPISEREILPVLVDSKDNILWLPGLKKSKFDRPKKEKHDIIIKYY